MTYLTHGQILIYYSGTRKKLIPLEISNLVSCFVIAKANYSYSLDTITNHTSSDPLQTYMLLGNLILSFVVGFLMTLLVESPTLNLIKMLIKKTNHRYLPNDCNNNFASKSNEVNSLKMEEI